MELHAVLCVEQLSHTYISGNTVLFLFFPDLTANLICLHGAVCVE